MAKRKPKGKMKNIYIVIASMLLFCCCAQNNLGETKRGTGGVIEFNRVTLEIPKDWNYSVNPKARSGTDQLQLFSKDRNRTVMITLTKDRPEIDFIEAEHQGRFEMLRRAKSIPKFRDCAVEGTGQTEMIWGRDGIFTKFDLYKNENKDPKERMMRIYNYGEKIVESSEVLFITAYVIGEEKSDTNAIIKTLKIKP